MIYWLRVTLRMYLSRGLRVIRVIRAFIMNPKTQHTDAHDVLDKQNQRQVQYMYIMCSMYNIYYY